MTVSSTLVTTWIILYVYLVLILLPEIVSTMKFRVKKLKNSKTLTFNYTQFFLNPLVESVK